MVELWSKPRSVASARLLVEFAGDRDIAESVSLRHTGVSAEELRDPDADITVGQELQLVRNVVAALGDQPGLGFLAGMRYHIVAQGVWGFAVASSPNLRGALEVGVRYADLSFSLAHVYLVPEGSQLSIVFDDSALPVDVRHFLLERDLAALAMMQREMFGIRLPAMHGQFPFERAPFYEVLAAEYLGTEATFSAAEARITFNAETLNFPLPQASAHTSAMYERQCVELLQRRRSRIGISGRVREHLISLNTATQAGVAARLNMSVRTLRRRLADEGTTFRELSEETAGMLAEDLLQAGLSAEQVANRLGYSSASAFTVAFRSWRGQTPGQFARHGRNAGLGPSRTSAAALGG